VVISIWNGILMSRWHGAGRGAIYWLRDGIDRQLGRSRSDGFAIAPDLDVQISDIVSASPWRRCSAFLGSLYPAWRARWEPLEALHGARLERRTACRETAGLAECLTLAEFFELSLTPATARDFQNSASENGRV